MAIRLRQRTILLGSLLAAVVSLGVIGYQLVPAWLGNNQHVASAKPIPTALLKPKPKAVAKKALKKVVKPTKKSDAKSTIQSEKKIEVGANQKSAAPNKPLTEPAKTVVESQEQKENSKKEESQKEKKSETVSKMASLTASKPSPKPAQKPVVEIEEEPERPYEETLPADVYIPPAIKMPTRKPKGPNARRIKRKLKNKRVRSSRLSALKHSQLPPWRRYAARNPIKKKEDKGKPKIVIVIDDMGIARKRSKKIVALPGPLTLSYLTYAKALYKQTRAARKAGHEIMLHVAMEPDNMANDPGPKVLLRDLEPDEIEKRLIWGLGRLHRYVGINNHMGSKFTTDRYGMTIVMKELRRRGLLFLDSRTASKSVGAVIAHAIGVPYAERNIFLDNVNKLKAVQSRLAELERLARRKGTAIAIGHPRNATIEALTTWLKEVKTRGFVIVPISTVVRVPKLDG